MRPIIPPEPFAARDYLPGRAGMSYLGRYSILGSFRGRTALCCMLGSTCEYVSRVMAMVEWPSISDATLGLTFWESMRVAQVYPRRQIYGFRNRQNSHTMQGS